MVDIHLRELSKDKYTQLQLVGRSHGWRWDVLLMNGNHLALPYCEKEMYSQDGLRELKEKYGLIIKGCVSEIRRGDALDMGFDSRNHFINTCKMQIHSLSDYKKPSFLQYADWNSYKRESLKEILFVIFI